MDRLISALLLLATGVTVPSLLLLPASIIACNVVLIIYRVSFWRTILRFLGLWIFFYFIVGIGRYIAGTGLQSLMVDGASSLGLALGVSCAVLLVVTAPPFEVLRALDRLKAPRGFSYALLSLIRLLPEIKEITSRQLALFALKGINCSGIRGKYNSYKRIISPLLVVLLEQQAVHARSLEARGFLTRVTYREKAESIISCRGVVAAAFLILNACLWRVVVGWIS